MDEADSSEAENNQVIQVCDWCRKPIDRLSFDEKLICPSCYDLLHNAGISDGEIFSKTASAMLYHLKDDFRKLPA